MDSSLRLPRFHYTKPNDPQHIRIDGNYLAFLRIFNLVDNEMEGNTTNNTN